MSAGEPTESKPAAKAKAPGVNQNPSLRQHGAPFYLNYLTKGIHHEMAQNRRALEDTRVIPPEAEVNQRKAYSIGATSTHPPYHILGDDERVRDAGTFCRMRDMLRERLQAADANRDGLVTYKEFESVVVGIVDRHLPHNAIVAQCRLLDPNGSGKIAIEDAVGVSLRTLATKPSQRQSLGAGNPLAWADESEVRDPDSARAAVRGGSSDPRQYYGMSGSERVATSPQRESRLPGLDKRVAGVASTARLRAIDSEGGTTAPLATRLPTTARQGTASTSRRGRGTYSPQSRSPRCPATPMNRAQALRSQWIKMESEAFDNGRRPPSSGAFFPRFSSPRGASLAPRPGVHIVGARANQPAAAAA